MLSCVKDFSKKCRRHEQRNYLKGNPIMGMAASQARLLSITARLTDNENSGQSVSYSKQRLADQTQQITNEYNEALDATKLTVLTGFNGAQANYEDISYNLMTGMQMATSTRQYIVTDTKGKILVTNQIAKAYEKSRGNYNQFLAELGYSQADINIQKTYKNNKPYDKDNNPEGKKAEHENAEKQIHEAWDRYFETVGITLFMPEHDLGFSWSETINPETKDYAIGDGYAGFKKCKTDENGNIVYEQKQLKDEAGNEVFEEVPVLDEEGKQVVKDNEPQFEKKPVMVDDLEKPVYETDKDGNIIYEPINYEGTSQESRDLYDYAMAITEAYLRLGTGENGVDFNAKYDFGNYKSANDATNNNDIKYYKNIFNKIQSSGYFTYTNTPAEIDENHLYTSEGTGTKGNVKKNPLQDNYTFEAALRDGSLRLEYYSTTDKAFKSTTISEDNCIQEVKDERAIARAESKYNQDMADLENKDNKLDLQLKKLDTEHTALQTEYESVKSVIDKNVEASFKIFS